MKILLVRPDGIGDQILSLPVATALRGFLPDARILFLSSAYAAPVLAHVPDLDGVVILSGAESFRELVRLFTRDIDAAIFLKPFRRLMFAAWLARVPLRVGTGYRWYSWMLNRRVYEHRSDFSRHESAYNLGLLQGLGFSTEEVKPPRLVVTKEERDWARALLGERKALRIVVHPGGFSSRTWQARHFCDLAVRLSQQGYNVLLTGSGAEGRHFRNEAGGNEWPAGVRDLMGMLNLRQLMAVIAESDIMVSLSSGPMHLAAALGVPTVSLFDPRRNQSPTRWQSLGKGVILMPDVPTCEKCIYEACPYWDCLDRITVDTVVRRVEQVWSERSRPIESPLAVARV